MIAAAANALQRAPVGNPVKLHLLPLLLLLLIHATALIELPHMHEQLMHSECVWCMGPQSLQAKTH